MYRAAGIAANIGLRAARAGVRNAARRYGTRRTAAALGAAAAAAAAANMARAPAVGSKRKARNPLGRRGGPKKPRADVIPDVSTYQQQQHYKRVSGKKVSKMEIVKKAVLAGAERQLFQWRYYSNPGATSFTYSLSQFQQGTGDRYLPLYVYDLSGRIQKAGANLFAPTVCKRAYCNSIGADDGKIKWADQSGLDAIGALSPYLQQAEGSQLSLSKSYERSMLEWLDMRFNIMAPTARPTTVTLRIVQLLDDEYDPWIFDGTNTTHQVFWQARVAALTGNNIHVYNTPNRKGWKVVATKTFELQPTSTTENDTRGHIKTLKWFYRVNKVFNYCTGGVPVTDDAEFSSTTLPANAPAGQNTGCYATTAARLFLVVSANAELDVASNPAKHASFEANLRMKHVTVS